MERYNDQGKKVARKRVQCRPGEGEAPLCPAVSCAVCGQGFHARERRSSHSYACRAHRGDWVPDLSRGGSVGIYACCGVREREDPGHCAVPCCAAPCRAYCPALPTKHRS